MSMQIELTVETKSPLHLGSGDADVNVDAEVVHDAYGMPYFPGRRLKGLLYESALEVQEMAERSGIQALTEISANQLFRHAAEGGWQLLVPNLYLVTDVSYQKLANTWQALQKTYSSLLRPIDVLSEYTSLRYQTKLVNGVAAKGSLHNMRVVEAGVKFSGILTLQGEQPQKVLPFLAATVRNLRSAGLKRSRGFGDLLCHLRVLDGEQKNQTEGTLLEEVLG